jgi:hypothetical protein
MNSKIIPGYFFPVYNNALYYNIAVVNVKILAKLMTGMRPFDNCLMTVCGTDSNRIPVIAVSAGF